MSPTVTQLLLFGCALILVPLALIGVGLGWALWRSKSNWGLLCWPVLGGWIAAALVPLLIGAAEFWGFFVSAGVIDTLVGVAIGLVAMLARTVARRSEATAKKAPGNFS